MLFPIIVTILVARTVIGSSELPNRRSKVGRSPYIEVRVKRRYLPTVRVGGVGMERAETWWTETVRAGNRDGITRGRLLRKGAVHW